MVASNSSVSLGHHSRGPALALDSIGRLRERLVADVQAHGNSTGAVENRSGHQGTVLGEGERPVFQMPASL